MKSLGTVLVTEASVTAGFGHASRMCGLAAAMTEAGQRCVIAFRDGSQEAFHEAGIDLGSWVEGPFLVWRSEADVAKLGAKAYVVDVKKYSAQMVNAIRDAEGRDSRIAVMMDTAAVPPNADVLIYPHQGGLRFRWPAGVPVLAGARYQPLRRPYWKVGSELQESRRPGDWWADGRLPEGFRTGLKWEDATRALCYVGVRMYEAACAGKAICAVARTPADEDIAKGLGVPVLMERDLGNAEIMEPTFDTPRGLLRWDVVGGAKRLADHLPRLF